MCIQHSPSDCSVSHSVLDVLPLLQSVEIEHVPNMLRRVVLECSETLNVLKDKEREGITFD